MDICDFLGKESRRVLFAQAAEDTDPIFLYGGIHRLQAGERGVGYKDNFTFHLILEGRAIAEIDGQEHSLTANDGYLYLPRAEKRLKAAKGGCTWSWIGFDGRDVRDVFAEHGIRTCRVIPGLSTSFRAMQLSLLAELASPGRRHVQECSARVQILITALIRTFGNEPASSPIQHEAIRKAQQLITHRAGTGLAVADLARAVGLERSYFSRLFHQEVGLTVREALAAARLRLAEGLLADPNLSIRAVAGMSGFDEYFSFHRFFKRQCGMSPSRFRRHRRAK